MALTRASRHVWRRGCRRLCPCPLSLSALCIEMAKGCLYTSYCLHKAMNALACPSSRHLRRIQRQASKRGVPKIDCFVWRADPSRPFDDFTVRKATRNGIRVGEIQRHHGAERLHMDSARNGWRGMPAHCMQEYSTVYTAPCLCAVSSNMTSTTSLSKL